MGALGFNFFGQFFRKYAVLELEYLPYWVMHFLVVHSLVVSFAGSLCIFGGNSLPYFWEMMQFDEDIFQIQVDSFGSYTNSTPL